MALTDLNVSADAVHNLEIQIKDNLIATLTHDLAVQQAVSQELAQRVEVAEAAVESLRVHAPEA